MFKFLQCIFSERSAKINRAYYNSDSFIQINLLKDNFTSPVFNAYISIVKQNALKSNGNCIVLNGTGSFTWSSNFNLKIGYQNNILCNYALTVQPGTTYLATLEQFSVEKGVDYLKFDDGEYDFDLNYRYQFILESYRNGTQNTYLFEFMADGSFVASGFIISFVENGKVYKLFVKL